MTYRDDDSKSYRMPPPNNNAPPNDNAPPSKDHPLIVALRDMDKMANTQAGLKALARIKHGIEHREQWIASRQAQIAELVSLQKEVLDAYDNGNRDALKSVMAEIDRIVRMSEGQSPLEAQVIEVMGDDDDPLVDAKRTAKKAFKPYG